MATANEIIAKAKLDFEKAKKNGDTVGMAKARITADKARGYRTVTKVEDGKYVQKKFEASPEINGALQKATVKLNTPKPIPRVVAPWTSVQTEYNISQPGIGNQIAKTLPMAKKQEIAQGTSKFFEKAPVQAGFMQGVSLNNPLKTLEKKIGVPINAPTDSNFYKAGEIGGTMAQFALPYGGATKGVGLVTKALLPNLGKVGTNVARSVATDLAVGLPLNVNMAYNKQDLRGTDALKNIAMNTGIDLIAGGVLETLGVVLKSGKKVASKVEFDKLPDIEKVEVLEKVKAKVPTTKPLKANDLYLHSTSAQFDNFKPSGDGFVYFSKKEGDNITQAERFFNQNSTRHPKAPKDRLIKANIDNEKIKVFDPSSDAKAKAIVEKYGLPSNQEWVKWDELAGGLSQEIRDNGYSMVKIAEPSGGYSYAVSNMDAIKILQDGKPIPRATKTIPQAPTSTVQPIKTIPQANAPRNPIAQKYTDLGADTNRFEEVAMVTTDSKSLKPTPLERLAGIGGDLKRKFVDAGDTVSKIARINGDNTLYQYYNNARNASRRAEYHIGEAQTNISGDAIGKSLKDIFKPIQDKGNAFYEDFQEYMYHLHNVDRMGFQEKAMQKLQDFEIQHQDLAGLNDKQLNEILKTADTDSAVVVKEYMNLIDNVKTATNKPVFGESITANESRQMADYLLKNNPSFIDHATEVRQYLDNMMQYRKDAGLVSDEGAEALAEMYKNYVPTYRVNPSAKGLNTLGNSANISTGIKRAKGSSKDLLPLHEQISKQTMQTVEAAHKNLFGRELAKNINDNTRQYIQELKKIDDTIDIDADVLPELKNSFNIYEDGVSYQMKVDDTLYEGIKALTGKDPNTLMDLGTKANKAFKELITSWSPMFLIRNVARDIQDVGLYSKNLKGFAKQYPKAVTEIATNGEMWKKYKALGGAGNSFFDYAQGYAKDPSWLRKNTLDRVEQLNMATEQLPRFTEFLATLEKAGPNPTYDDLMVAMYNAADATVNFGRSGTWGKTINSTFVPFFNPAMQGTSKVIRRFTETKGVKGWTELVLKISALGIAPSMLNEMIYHDDPEYANLQDRVKDTNFMFKLGDGEWIKIPKGRVLSMFGSTAQRVYRDIKGDENAYAGLVVTAMDQNAPINPFESNIVAPIITAGFNKTWYGGDIEPQRVQDMRPSERYTEVTTELSKAIVGKMGKFADKHEISPMKLDYLLDAYTGIIGDVAMPIMTPRAETNPLKKAFVADSVTQNKISEDFYKAKDEIMYSHNSEKGTLSDSTMNRYMNRVATELTDLNEEIRKIESGIGTDANKRERTREVRKQINEIQLDALSNLKKIQETAKKISKKYDDLDIVVRETNREVFGAEKALQMYNKDVYEKAQANVGENLTYDDFYEGYFAQSEYSTNTRKAIALKDIGSQEVYDAFKISDKHVAMGSALADSGLVPAYDTAYAKLKGVTGSEEKKQIIDELNPGMDRKKLTLLYEAFDISQGVGRYERIYT